MQVKTRLNNAKSVINDSPGRKLFLAINYIFLALIVVVSMVPIINILALSFSDKIHVAAGDVKLWPVGFTLESYAFVMKNPQFLNSFLVSVERSLLGVAINMACTILVAYPLSKADKQFRARKYYLWYFIITMLFSGGLIPWYMVVKYTGIYNSIWALVIPGAVPVYNVILLMNFFRELPKEIEESAFIDGAGHFMVLMRMYLPLSLAALATLVLFSFVFHWNSWFDGMIFMRSKDGIPLQTYLQSVLTIPDLARMDAKEIESYFRINIRSVKAAEIFIATLPIFSLYPFLQKYFTKGIVLGSVKG